MDYVTFNVTFNVTLFVTWLVAFVVTFNVTFNVTLFVTWLVAFVVTFNVTSLVTLRKFCTSLRFTSSRRGGRAFTLTLLCRPAFDGLLCDNRVIQPAISAVHKAAQCAILDFAPAFHCAAVAREQAVISRQTPGGNLMPGGAPQEHRRLELLAV